MAWQNPQSGNTDNEVTASLKVTHVSVISLCGKPDTGVNMCLVKPVTTCLLRARTDPALNCALEC